MLAKIAIYLLSAALLIHATSAATARRYPLYAAPLYSPAIPALAAAPVVAAPVAAAAPVYPAVAEVACAPACVGTAACVQGVCACAAGVVYSPVVGCAPPPAPVAVPVVAGRVIPQALPGGACEPGVECTGGSVCSLGICLCPPELVQEGSVCVARTVYGAVVPPPPPPAPVVVPAAPVAVAPAPVAYTPYKKFKYKIVIFQIPVGAACVAAAAPCVPGAVCHEGVCACTAAYVPTATACIRRRK
uniref:EB domain-containing protein n=1 Tax=Syphacia muris TaxID=451379 RepID=A0A0N5AP12_9BILA